MAKKQITNYAFTPGSNETFNAFPNAYARLVANKTFIQKQSVAYIQNQIQSNTAPFQDYEYSTAKCERDIGYVLEALINDLKFNGNVQTRYIASFYWIGDVPQVDGDRAPEVAVYTFITGLINNFVFTGTGGVMLGASGAIYGILMAFGLLFPNLELMLLFPPIPIKAKYMVFVMGFITYALDRSGTVAHLAHFGGAFAAFLIIMYWKSQGK
jgi:hypothetical protein